MGEGLKNSFFNALHKGGNSNASVEASVFVIKAYDNTQQRTLGKHKTLSHNRQRCSIIQYFSLSGSRAGHPQ